MCRCASVFIGVRPVQDLCRWAALPVAVRPVGPRRLPGPVDPIGCGLCAVRPESHSGGADSSAPFRRRVPQCARAAVAAMRLRPQRTPTAVVQPAVAGLAWASRGPRPEGSVGLGGANLSNLCSIGTLLLPRQNYGQSDVRWSAGAPHNESTRRHTHAVWDGPGSLAVLVLQWLQHGVLLYSRVCRTVLCYAETCCTVLQLRCSMLQDAFRLICRLRTSSCPSCSASTTTSTSCRRSTRQPCATAISALQRTAHTRHTAPPLSGAVRCGAVRTLWSNPAAALAAWFGTAYHSSSIVSCGCRVVTRGQGESVSQ